MSAAAQLAITGARSRGEQVGILAPDANYLKAPRNLLNNEMINFRTDYKKKMEIILYIRG